MTRNMRDRLETLKRAEHWNDEKMLEQAKKDAERKAEKDGTNVRDDAGVRGTNGDQ